jgi:uncharacterized membrane protein required for colicin V production
MNYNRMIAGFFVGAGALLLIYKGNIAEGCTLLGSMVGFFVGEANGKKVAKEKTE